MLLKMSLKPIFTFFYIKRKLIKLKFSRCIKYFFYQHGGYFTEWLLDIGNKTVFLVSV